MNSALVKDYLLDLQRRIVSALEALDGNAFREDRWERPEGGGGICRLIEEVNADTPRLLAFFGVERIEDIPATQFDRVVRSLEKGKRRAA